MDTTSIINSLIVAAIVGLVSAVTKLWVSQKEESRRVSDLELKVAENYLHKDELKEVKRDVREIRDLVGRLCLKLEVPVFTEPYK